MLKLALLLTLGVTGGYVASGRLTYSAVQTQLFQGAGLKVMPDPSNIWSFHDTVSLNNNQTVDIPIVVDFDNNQRMDSELTFARVYVTDVQAVITGSVGSRSIELHDDSGARWTIVDNHHGFATPIVVPVGSRLFVRATASTLGSVQLRVNVLGRLATL